MTMSVLMVVGGLLLLAFGGDFLVRSALVLARRLGVSTFLAGVVVVGFGTSAPELLVSLNAALGGRPDIALGNVVGSNIANVLFILGVAALLSPIPCGQRSLWRDILLCVLGSLVLLGLGLYGMIPRPAGVGLVLILVIYLWVATRSDLRGRQASSETKTQGGEADWGLWQAGLIAVVSAAVLSWGADLLIDGASYIAREFGISDRVIGLTLVAIGTSLPELATAIVAALRRETDVIIGNVFGSTIFNIFSILGITALFVPLPIFERIVSIDIPTSIGAIVLVALMIRLSSSLRMRHGVFLVGLYVVYIAMLFS